MSNEKKIGSWHELLEKTIDLGLGAVMLTKESAIKLADEMVKRGDVTKEEGKKLVADLMEKGKDQKEKLEDFIADIVQRAMEKADIAKQSHIENLEQRIAELEERLNKPQES